MEDGPRALRESVVKQWQEQCVCHRPLDKRHSDEFVRLVVGFEDREQWQLRGGDVARHGRGH